MSSTFPIYHRTRLFTSSVATALVMCLFHISPCNAQSLTSPAAWPDQIEVTKHPKKHYQGVYVQTARLINGLPVYELENKRETTDSLYRFNYLYAHKIAKGKNEALWVLQPVTPYADEWLANVSGWGSYPWNAKWGAGKVTLKRLPESRKRADELGKSFVGLPTLKYNKNNTAIIGFMFRVPLEKAKDWISVDQSPCPGDFPFVVNRIYDWRERHPETCFVFNTNFFKPNAKSYNVATCAKVYGIAIKNNKRRAEATKKEGAYTLDALLIHKNKTANIISGHRALYDPNNPLLKSVNSAAGGYIILERGHSINPEGMIKLHAGNLKRARVAVGIKSIYASEIFVFIIPAVQSRNGRHPMYPPWELVPSRKKPIGPSDGMTMGEVQAFMKDEGMEHGIMFDGGGSATVIWRTPPVGVGKKSMNYRIPPYGKSKDIDVTTGKRILRKVPSVLGFE